MAKIDKLERLMNLTAVLLDAEAPLSAVQLQARIDGYPEDPKSARRQFERDKDDLRELGIPLRVVPVPGTNPPLDGYTVDKDEYYLRDPGLTPAELEALHLASTLVRIEGLQGPGGMWKLGGSVADEAAAPAAVAPLAADPNLATIFGALADRRVVTFRYHDADRELEPRRLDNQSGRWYVSGFDRSRGEERVFRLDRVDGAVQVVGEAGAYERPDAASHELVLDPWSIGGDEPVEARLAIDAAQAPVVVHHLGADAVEATRADGTVVVRIEVTNREGFRSFVLGFLDHAELLDPPELRQDLVDWLAALAHEVPA